MDKDTIVKIVGELYINNHLLGKRIEALSQEIFDLKKILEGLNTKENPQVIGTISGQ